MMKKNLLIAIVVCGALLLGAVLMMQREIPSSQVAVTQIFSGKIVSITSGAISINDEKNGALQLLTPNDTLSLGDTVVATEGTNATLELSGLNDITEDADIIFIKPLTGQQYPINIKIERQEDGSIKIVIHS